METVFEFRYNPDTYESAAYTVSIHRTRKGAEMAMEFHRAKVKKEHDQLYSIDPEDKTPYNWARWWEVEETKVLN